jgi:hypothetical protein
LWTILVVSLIAPLALAACGGGPSPIPTVAVTAAEFSFSLPETIAGGLIRLQLTNSGQESHHLQFVKLNQGVSQQQFQETLQETLQAFPQEGEAALGRIFRIVAFTGGPSGIGPGGQSEAVVDLLAGDYVLLCFIAGADGIPHLAKGMVQPLTVTAPPSDRPAEPEALGTVGLDDFAFTGVPATLPEGRTTLKVTNQGQEPHEMTVLRLEGITAQQAVEIFTAPPGGEAPAGPPPFKDAGGFRRSCRDKVAGLRWTCKLGNTSRSASFRHQPMDLRRTWLWA